jgi:hypothetical protein
MTPFLIEAKLFQLSLVYTLGLKHKEKADLEENYQTDTSRIFAFCNSLCTVWNLDTRNNNDADLHLNY